MKRVVAIIAQEDMSESSTSSSRERLSNNIVAESDLQNAMKRVEEDLKILRESSCIMHHADNSTSPTGVAEKENGSIFESRAYQLNVQELLLGAEESIRNHTERLVEAKSDKEHFTYTKHFFDESEEDRPTDEESENEDDQDDSEAEYDDHELLDQDALDRVRTLRSNVRKASERLTRLRCSIKDRALALARNEVEVAMVRNQDVGNRSFDVDRFESELQKIQANEDAEKPEIVLNMEQSLDALMESLEGTDLRLPKSAGAFRETLETVGQSLDRQKGGEQNLSQTERAIVSRENEGYAQILEGVENKERDTLEPMERIALSMSHN